MDANELKALELEETRRKNDRDYELKKAELEHARIKVELEVKASSEKLSFDREKFQVERRFFFRNGLGAMTAAIGALGLVKGFNIYEAAENATKLKARLETLLNKTKGPERVPPEEIARIGSAIPKEDPESAKQIFEGLIDGSRSIEERMQWQQSATAHGIGAKPVLTSKKTVYVHYKSRGDAAVADQVVGALTRGGYNAPGKQFVVQHTKGDIRYYESDVAEAQQIKKVVESTLSDSGYKVDLGLIYTGATFPKVDKNLYEVWLPALKNE